MELTEHIELNNMNKEQLLLNLINILKSTEMSKRVNRNNLPKILHFY